jgi:exodeoxyribonuclease V gamma subunit
VLVSQLRDYLAAGWGLDPRGLTTEHALQPFSRRYFEQGAPLATYAAEWRAAHEAGDQLPDGALPPYELEPDAVLTLGELASFLKQPARQFFRRRLGVTFGETVLVGEDDEPFALDALQRYFLEDRLLEDQGDASLGEPVEKWLSERAERLGREGVLPIGQPGQQLQRELVAALKPVRSAWLALVREFATPAPKLAVELAQGQVMLSDWIDRLRSNGAATAWLDQSSSRVLDRKGQLRPEKLLAAWLRQLAAAACGHPLAGFLVARDALVAFDPLAPDEARAGLARLASLWRANLDAPLPVAARTALTLLQGGDARAAYDGGFDNPGEAERDEALRRLWPEYAQLAGEPGWKECAQDLYGPLLAWSATHVHATAYDGEVA